MKSIEDSCICCVYDDNGSGLPEALRTYYVSRVDQRVYLPAFDGTHPMCAMFDGEPIIMGESGVPYIPLDWAKREFPDDYGKVDGDKLRKDAHECDRSAS